MGLLSDIGGALFGTSPQANVGSYGTLSPEQSAALQQLLAQLTGGSSPLITPYTGQLTADQNLAQIASLTALENAANTAAAGGGAGATSATALTDVINASPQDLSNYIQSSIMTPMMQEYQTQILPSLEGRFAGQGAYGSDRIMSENIAAGNLEKNMSSAIASATTQALQQQQQNKIQAALGLNQVGATNISNILGIQQGAGVAQAAAQQPLTAAYNAYLNQQQQQATNINAILQALGIKTKENIATVTPGTSGLLGGLGQGLGTGLGMLGGKALLGGAAGGAGAGIASGIGIDAASAGGAAALLAL